MRAPCLRLACLCFCLVGGRALLGAAELPFLDFGGVREEHLLVPMRDGTRLSAYVYFPPGEGPWPVIFTQRLAALTGNRFRQDFAELARAGYVVAGVNFRGAHLSEGVWRGYRSLGWGEQKDGYDLVEWFARQPWSTGKVGTFGGSQAGFAQNFLAVAQPPHLVCQFMVDTGLSLFHEGFRIGGAARPERFKRLGELTGKPAENRALLEEGLRHQAYDDYWREEDCTLHFDKMNVPCFTVGSWYDYMSVGSIRSFVGRQHHGGPNSRGRQQLVLGPWLHGGAKSNAMVGELRYPEDARFDLRAHMVRWFDHFLKGVDNGVERQPAVRYYVMGAIGEPGAPGNEWRTADDWPVRTQATSYYFQEGGGLDRSRPDRESSRTVYTSDPQHPMSIPGISFPGARDAREFERQADVRTFTTEPLAEPVEWTGRVRVELHVASTARDTDFIVRVSDVYPDGRSILLVDMVRRARFREGWEQTVLMEPGKVYPVNFDVGSLSQIFNRGHRIRVTVASTGAPFFERNPQTGEDITADFPSETVVATNSVYHQRSHASRVIAPVVHGTTQRQ